MAVNVSPFSSRTYSKCTKLLHTAYGIAAETLQSEVYSEVRKAYEAPTDVPVVDLSVSFDGSWLTRGHTYLIGIACVIDILTGYVIDFEVMCHRRDCDINHSGSSTSMEMEATLIFWDGSQEMGFRYSTLLFGRDCGITFQDGDRFNSGQVIYSQFGLTIHQNDHQARRRFVEWAQNEIAVVPDFHKRILFSNEAHFWLNDYVNKQNCRIWCEANPQVYVKTPLHPEKLTVWCALWAGGIIGPYFFKNDEVHNVTVNGDR
ncbi:uncharacterized protein TNCV_1594611 [Trichonephila clavipes]|nr:uncharacterized protein TNCV_1594611 [Trichonephila clavipes]